MLSPPLFFSSSSSTSSGSSYNDALIGGMVGLAVLVSGGVAAYSFKKRKSVVETDLPPSPVVEGEGDSDLGTEEDLESVAL